MKVSVRDSKSNPVHTYDLATNAFGSVNTAFDLAEGAMLGSYQITVEALGETSSQSFEVQDYQKPEFELTLKPSAQAVVGGDTVTVDVDVRYFTGQPVTGASLDFSTFDTYYYSYNASDVWFPTGEPSFSGSTDPNGHFKTSLKIPIQDYYYPDSTSPDQSKKGIFIKAPLSVKK